MSFEFFSEADEEVQEAKGVWILWSNELVVQGPRNVVDPILGLHVYGYDHVVVKLTQVTFKHLPRDRLLLLVDPF